MKKTIVVASGNKGKLKEIAEIFSDYEIIPLKELEAKLGKKFDIVEDEKTFKDNARVKAIQIAQQLGDNSIVMADDSGISIDALDGFPGVHTQRWMDADDHIKNLALLEKMKGKTNRKCKYTTAIAVSDGKMAISVDSSICGNVTHEVRGENGFGFDEIFELKRGLTLAEITSEEKYRISPRKKALNKIKNFLI
ncbi:MAG: RdgB/HAM1 family non-canonical purine NTP pyrophosphatase [Clostridia bacterium]|nr:RdgB/HAM1 family non-canonical purine NTP pyrophosphatase [Clostridia bacterium]